MSWLVFYKLLAIFITVAIGWFVGHMRWLGGRDAGGQGGDPARVLSAAAFYLFVPALLFRTTARVDFASMPWLTVSAFFAPLLAMILIVYGVQRWRGAGRSEPALPCVQAITASFGNTLQIGVPLAAGVFGESGLAVHITVVSLHALVILSVLTLLVEHDLARAQAGMSLKQTLLTTMRNTVIHPVVLPVVAGLVFNGLGLSLPAVLDEVLQLLGTAVVPLCLTLIGMSLAYYGWPRDWRGALGLAGLKLFLLPALVLVVAHWGFGLAGQPLAVIVMLAALPVGSNALIFAQRYQTREMEVTAATVISTLAFVLTAPLWLALLALLALVR
ncbi:AEC family transporter [Roseateles sp. DAIF2]|uniref:AEC family transporter n=1 Tax=Roseateles sp. DAIF2 TaxID=2714952 RepID=UPI0018A30BF0|nr:AEC family transporter [Roseateles sp. DAIF2]QPF75914.1 AEC family transporter [Roseateles sp. DAIF2]